MYDLRVRGVRHRGAIPEARTKAQATQVEAKIRTELFEGRYGRPPSGISLARVIKETYLPWARLNKRSWQRDVYCAEILCQSQALKGKTLSEVSP